MDGLQAARKASHKPDTLEHTSKIIFQARLSQCQHGSATGISLCWCWLGLTHETNKLRLTWKRTNYSLVPSQVVSSSLLPAAFISTRKRPQTTHTSRPVHAWTYFLTVHADLLTSFLTSHKRDLF